MNAADRYIGNILELMGKLAVESGPSIEAAADLVAECLGHRGTLRAFGTGHSHMFALEIFYRAGGLVRVDPILDEGLMLHAGAARSTSLERLPGYASILLDHSGAKAGDVMLIASNSGRNTVTIEMAIEARKRGLSVIVLTSMNHTRSVSSRHASGKLLWELGDVVLDNLGCPGDACVPIASLGRNVSPTSSVMGCILLNAVMARAVELAMERNYKPEVFSSSNIDGGDDINETFIREYTGKIRSL